MKRDSPLVAVSFCMLLMAIQLQTQVDLPKTDLQITPSSRILFLGSCFSNHIGERMRIALPHVFVNPMGVLYNPLSIQLALQILQERRVDESFLFFGRDELWHSWTHSSVVSAASREACCRLIDERLSEIDLSEIDVLFVTFGTARVYRLKETGRVVANCHKELAMRFEEQECTVEELLQVWEQVLTMLPTKTQIVFTISPYRYAKYGFHESQLSKSRLLLAVDMLCQRHARCHYFPAYEIVLDELRDYRFYTSDMLHVTEQTADYIWERLQQWCFDETALQLGKERTKKYRQSLHYPLTHR